MNHMRHATAASPTMEAPAAMPPMTLGLSAEVSTGSDESLGPGLVMFDINVDV